MTSNWCDTDASSRGTRRFAVEEVFAPGGGTHVVITVGNLLRSDDGAGPYIWEGARAATRFVVLNAGENPENLLEQVARLAPSRITLIDAADFGGVPGEVRVVDEKDIPESCLSTHAIPLRVIAGILRQDTGAVLRLVGIQPRTVAFGEGLSAEVKESADRIVAYLLSSGGKEEPDA